MGNSIKDIDEKIQELRDQMIKGTSSSTIAFHLVLMRLEYLIKLRAMIILDTLDLE